MKHPIWWALGAGVAVIVAAFVPPLWQMLQPAGTLSARPPGAPGGAASGAAGQGAAGDGVAATADRAEQGLPWQVAVLADGTSRVMGLHLGADTLAQAQARIGDSLQLALVAQLGEVGALEALAEPFAAGFVSGRLVLAFDAAADARRRWRDGASGSTPMDGGLRRFALRAQDIDQARQAPLAGLSFLPAVRLTEADVRQRFGAPAATQALAGGALLLQYPAIGVTVTVAPGQRGVIQYVAPRDAARLGLAAALPAATSAATSAASSAAR